MTFFKAIHHDIYHGLIRNPVLYLIPLLLGIFIFADFYLKAALYVKTQIAMWEDITFGDLLLYAYGGMKKYTPSPENHFQIPVTWLILMLTPSILMLWYLVKTMETDRRQILIRLGSRMGYWLSKCLWVLCFAVTFQIVVIGSMYLCCLLFKISTSIHINGAIMQVWLELDQWHPKETESFLPVKLLVDIIAVHAVLLMLQMTLTLFFRYNIAFLINIVLHLSSAYICFGGLPGNFEMLLRYSWLLEEGMSEIGAYLWTVLLSIVLLTIGSIRIHTVDILDNE